MKSSIVVLMALSGAAAAVRAQAPQPSPFRMLRYDEDWRHLADPARHTGTFDAWKHVPIGADPDRYVSFGGESRTRYEYFDDPVFGLRGVSRDDFFLQRLLLHADLHLGPRTGWHGRAFVQGLTGLVDGQELPKAATQDNQFDLQQGFVDIAHPDLGTLRLGRQELWLGSARLVTPREPTNGRLAFEGARGMFALLGAQWDALLVRPVQPETGVFDDAFDDQQVLWGLYGMLMLAPERRLGLDVYYLGLERENSRFGAQRGDELRHSFGARLWGKAEGWDHDTEVVAQFGDYAVAGRPRQDIAAWTVASHTGYTFATVPWQPRVSVKCNVASGDHDPDDGVLNTFNALFPRLNYFSDAGLLAPANFFDVQPALRVQPQRDVTLAVGMDLFYRHRRDDAVYGPGGPVIAGDASRRRFVGSATTLTFEWRVSPRIDWACSFTHFERGDVVRDAGGEDVEFFATWWTMRF